MNERKTLFQTKLSEAKSLAEDEVEDVLFPQYLGLTFKQFWYKLNEELEIEMEFYDYEDEILKALEDGKYVWIKKSTGLGVTEFMIRWIAWNCLKDTVWADKQVDVNVVLVTGPRIDLSITIMNRLKNLFDHEFKTKETVCKLNGNRIEAFPSHHLSSARGLNPQIVFLDESDFFPKGQQQEARDVSERYIAKTDPHIVMVSTPNLPGGLYEDMEMEKDSMYNRMILLYKRGLNKIYSEEQIAIAKLSPAFEREYNGQYGYGSGDIFENIDDCIEEYSLERVGGRAAVTGDPAFGYSKFGICAGENVDNIVHIKEAEERARTSPSAMLDVMEEFAKRFDNNVKIDAAHPGFIRDLVSRGIPAIPVNFGLVIPETESATTQSLRSKMTINAAQMVKNKQVRIHPKFTTLIAQLRAVSFDAKGGIDKTETSFDVVDAFIMLCWELKEFDYSSIGITHDGNIIQDKKTKQTKGLTIHKRTVE